MAEASCKTPSWARRWVQRLPLFLRQAAKKLYYLRVVRRFTEADWPMADVMKLLVKPGNVVVDAGANVGYITALLARWVGPAGRVHSFEPVPETAAVLAHVVRCLGLSQVTVHACGLSDAASRGRMEIPQYAEGIENFYESRVVDVPAGEGRVVDVELDTLDNVLPAGAPALIKMDVEGHELRAIRGALKVLARCKPALLIEVSGDPNEEGKPAHELFRLLGGLGYKPWTWSGTGLRPHSGGCPALDYLFLTESHLPLLRPVIEGVVGQS